MTCGPGGVAIALALADQSSPCADQAGGPRWACQVLAVVSANQTIPAWRFGLLDHRLPLVGGPGGRRHRRLSLYALLPGCGGLTGLTGAAGARERIGLGSTPPAPLDFGRCRFACRC